MKIVIEVLFVIIVVCVHQSTTKAVPHDKSSTRISTSQECANDVKKLCKDLNQNTDIAVLTCLQDSEEVMRQISIPCQNFLWSFKHKLTTSNFFDKITNDQCDTDLNAIKECKEADLGHKVPCLLDHKDKITGNDCLKFLEDISIIVFSDYHLTYRFIDKCKPDITKFMCGRMTQPGSKDTSEKDDEADEKPISETKVKFVDYITSQSHTVDCLIDSIQEVHPDCQHQILRLSELQSKDFHLNRGLYFACRDDREVLCGKVKSGEGRVYNCLMKQKFSDKMSEKCRKELTRKQQVESLDFGANYPLLHNCKQDIMDNKCFKNSDGIQQEIVLMSVVLMCLHDAEIHGKKLNPTCRAEIDDRRSAMIEDFKISPEALAACKEDVRGHCQDQSNAPGELVHCLMKLAEPDLKSKQGQLSKTCMKALVQMVKAANPTDNVMSSDVAIRAACSSTYLALCSDISTDKEAFQCLIDNLNSPKMAEKCRDKLTSLLYFISLDISIDDQLTMACHKDAVRLCKEPDTFRESQEETVVHKQLQYHCMFDYYKKDKIQLDLVEARGLRSSEANVSLSAECAHQMFNLIKVQASKIELDPIVFEPCFEDLGKYCGKSANKGKEHECLQSNYKSLQPICAKAVIEFSQLEDVDVRLNRMLSDACLPMVKEFCSHEKPEQILVCLEAHKFHDRMSKTCHAAIEHIQIMSLEEYHIDHRFASFCGKEIDEYCKDELSEDMDGKVVTKAKIVSCLSRTVINKLLKGDTHPLSNECRRQFTFELLQRSKSTKLDPTLLKDCKADIDRFCSQEEPNKINHCLRKNQDRLHQSCHKRLFKREHLEALDAEFDGELQQTCAQMIHERCSKVSGRKLFGCLRRLMNENGFDQECKQLILSRLERRMNDIRLNPGLIEDCRTDIKRYCRIDNPEFGQPKSGIEYEGMIIHCLKKQYTNSSKTLQLSCQRRIHEIIVEANTYMNLDPILRKKCSEDIQKHCKKDKSKGIEVNINYVHNCLKHKFLRDELEKSECAQEVARLLKEGRADVHVDLELFDACENAIMKHCQSESFGDSKKMNCLLSLYEDKKATSLLGKRCKEMIKDRRDMWQKAGNFESQSLQDLYLHVAHSSTRIYLVSMLGLIVAALVLIGICCGRVTKRVAVDLKNK